MINFEKNKTGSMMMYYFNPFLGIISQKEFTQVFSSNKIFPDQLRGGYH